MSSNGTGGDVFEAMKYGARMTTRPGVPKVMILITCDYITDGYFYGDAITMLKEELIQLHYINPLSLELRNRKQTLVNNILGFDKSSAFTVKNLNSLTGDVALRGQLRVPKDYLSTLATESGGSVFTQTSFIRSSRDFKYAVSIFARRVARTAIPNDCLVIELLYICLVMNNFVSDL